MAQSSWILVDLRVPDEPAVLCRDGTARDRTSLARALGELTGGTRGRELASDFARWSGGGRAGAPPTDLDVRPVPGAAGSLSAAWVRPRGGQGVPPFATSLLWDPAARLVTESDEARILFARDDTGPGGNQITSAEALRNVDVADTIALAQAMLARPPRRWRGTVRAPLRDTSINGVLDLLPVAGEKRIPGVLFEVDHIETTKSVEALAMAALSRVAPVHVVLMDVHRMRALRWLTDPPPGVAWKDVRDNRDTPHPDDVKRIFEKAGAALNGDIVRGSLENIRLRFLEGGWLVVDAAGELVPDSDPPLLILQMAVRGRSDEPDPVPVDDQGHPGIV
ncbi:hypothetical protein [uncultured Williamsia sp.]|uniref:hypothetical protein n=1 Tax=uncultured Williamsia sp. TaxID=259311 RepID=UPI002614FFE7|nr:hypothetical protein [uncultured Williamsia sp.]